jgi:hypothetical protein
MSRSRVAAEACLFRMAASLMTARATGSGGMLNGWQEETRAGAPEAPPVDLPIQQVAYVRVGVHALEAPAARRAEVPVGRAEEEEDLQGVVEQLLRRCARSMPCRLPRPGFASFKTVLR